MLRAPGSVLILFAKGEPPGDPVGLRYEQGILHVSAGRAKIKFGAHWPDISPPRIEVALDAPDRDYLQLALEFPASQILSSGLEKGVAAAEKRFQAAVNKAYAAMKLYGISRADLKGLLRSLVTQAAK